MGVNIVRARSFSNRSAGAPPGLALRRQRSKLADASSVGDASAPGSTPDQSPRASGDVDDGASDSTVVTVATIATDRGATRRTETVSERWGRKIPLVTVLVGGAGSLRHHCSSAHKKAIREGDKAEAKELKKLFNRHDLPLRERE